MRSITGTHIAYLHTCRRKLWLFANAVHMEHTSDVVAEGRLIGETSYSDRSSKFTEVEIDGIKIDFYDARRKVIHEVKKSNKMENAHIAQVKYYIHKLEQHRVEGVKGIIEYPRLKRKQEVEFTEEDRRAIPRWEKEIEEILSRDQCPERIRAGICRQCSYFDFCYSD